MSNDSMNRLESADLGRNQAARENESHLIARILAGDSFACESLVRQYGGRMLAVARRLLRSEEDSADAVQDAFLSVFRSINSFQGNSSLATWLYRIVTNAALMKLRSESHRRDVPLDDLLPMFDEYGHPAHPVLAWTEAIQERSSQAEIRAQIRACVDQLPEPHRTIVLLRDIEGFDTEETARLLGISVGAVKTRLHRARQALRPLLESIFIEE